MKYKVIISNNRHTFPIKGLNELLAAHFWNARLKKFQNEVKANNDKACRLAIRKFMYKVKIDKPIICHFKIYAKDRMHDRGNIYSATEKSFLDALQQCKVIKNDGFDDVLDSTFETYLDSDNPRVEVMIQEVE